MNWPMRLVTVRTVVPTKSDSDVIIWDCYVNLHVSSRESIDHLCTNPILRTGLIHKWSIDYKPPDNL